MRANEPRSGVISISGNVVSIFLQRRFGAHLFYLLSSGGVNERSYDRAKRAQPVRVNCIIFFTHVPTSSCFDSREAVCASKIFAIERTMGVISEERNSSEKEQHAQ